MKGLSSREGSAAAAALPKVSVMRMNSLRMAMMFFAVLPLLAGGVSAQGYERKISLGVAGEYEFESAYGRVQIEAITDEDTAPGFTATSNRVISRDDVSVDTSKGKIKVTVSASKEDRRIDIVARIPARSVLKISGREGEVRFSGDFKEVRAETTSGSVVADVPLSRLKYKFLWTASQPRLVSEAKLNEGEERNAGKFVIEGELPEEASMGEDDPGPVDLEVRTARGIVLLNVDPSEVPSNLAERPLTEAAKAMIRGGDILLTEAIRRASPKYFGDYAATLPPRRTSPELTKPEERRDSGGLATRTVNVQVMDENNRAVNGLKASDFELSEGGREREIVSVETADTPFNLVLLIDVSGSVVSYVDFIRKAARAFVDTVDGKDRISIVIFNDDVRTLSGFTTDERKLSDSLDTFDAGGATAYYDALGYVLSDTLQPLKGERSAIVALTDGEDNRSFLSFNSLLGSVQESGALVYPLYVPAGVVARAASGNRNAGAEELGLADPLREKYLSDELSSNAEKEGETLARVSGGVYYPISRLSELQTAYNEIVRQLRTAYTVTYRTDPSDSRSGGLPRVRVKVKRPGTFVRVGSGIQ